MIGNISALEKDDSAYTQTRLEKIINDIDEISVYTTVGYVCAVQYQDLIQGIIHYYGSVNKKIEDFAKEKLSVDHYNFVDHVDIHLDYIAKNITYLKNLLRDYSHHNISKHDLSKYISIKNTVALDTTLNTIITKTKL